MIWKNKICLKILLLLLSALSFGIPQERLAQDSSRRSATDLGSDRIPGYPMENPDPDSTGRKDSTGKVDSGQMSQDPESTEPRKPILTKLLGFSEDSRYVEIRTGGSFWMGGPLITNLNKNIRNIGFDTDYTYNYGSNIQKAALYSGAQGYSGVEPESMRMGILFDKAVSDKWSVGGGVDYREIRISRIPNNLPSRSFIVGAQRFPGTIYQPTQEEVQTNIALELAGLASFTDNTISNKILFLEINATYHFLSENAWDPYLRPIFALGYDTTTKNYALKLGGAAGIRYYFANGIYLGSEVAMDTIYMAQEKLVKSQAISRIHDANLNFFLGKKFD